MEKNQMNLINNNHLHAHNNEQSSDSFRLGIPLMQETCQVHTNSRLDYVSVDSEQNYVFKCMYCVTDDNINQLTLIPIEQILIADSKTVFANFPLKDRDLTREIKHIASSPPTGIAIKQSIDTFFKEFRAKLLDRIDSIQQKMVEKAQSISDFGEVLMTHYNRASSKEHLKSIISDRQKSIENKTTEIKDICAEALSKDEENKQLFIGLINSMKTLEKATDFETPKHISETILNQLESINMFLVDDIAELQKQLLNADPSQLKQSNQSPSSDAIANLMKLVSNKLNEVSSDQCAQLEKQLNRYSFIIGQLPVPVPGQLYDSLEKFDSEETNVFAELIKNYSQDKIDSATEQTVEHIQQVDQSETYPKEQLSANQIIDFVCNKTNFCSPEFVKDFSKVMTTLEGLLRLFKVRRPTDKSEERAAFNGLNPKQFENFVKLATQVNQMTRIHADQYLLSNSPQYDIQLNSTRASHLIGNRFQIFGSQEERAQSKRDLDYLFVKYPILELLPHLKFFNPQPMTFTRTKYYQSSEMVITMNGNELELTFPNCNGKYGQAVSEILKNESGYLLRLKFNRPYGKSTSGYFRIGLIPNSKIDSSCVLSDCKHGFGSDTDYGAERVIRGGRLASEPLRSVTSEVEFRWCISKRQFFISDSTYSNVNHALEQYFNPTEIYRFGVNFYGIADGDWKITIIDFSEIDVEAVSQFE